MKNFINTVRKSGPLRTKDNFIITPSMVDANGQLSIWNLMQILNEVKGGRMNQLLLNVRFEDNVKSMDLKIYDNAYLEEELVVESSFTPIGRVINYPTRGIGATTLAKLAVAAEQQ